MRWSHRWGLCLRTGLVLLGALWTCAVMAQTDLQPVPALSSRVVDQTSTLDAVQRNALDDKLAAFEAAHGSQVVVLIVHTTAPEDIASYANRVGNAWKIGRKEVGDGLLLIVAKDDRKVRMEVPKTLEGAIPDLAAKQVIDQAITPRFKQGDFAGGLDAGVEAIMALIRQEALPQPVDAVADADSLARDAWIGVALVDSVIFVIFVGASGWTGAWIVLFCSTVGAMFGAFAWLATGSDAALMGWALGSSFFTFLVVAELRKPKGERVNTVSSGTRSHDTLLSSGAWTSGSSGSSDSGGGGFTSGGGGDFGGGGASGDW
jgi:uncharacterized protein